MISYGSEKGPDYTCTPVIVKGSLEIKKKNREIPEHLRACKFRKRRLFYGVIHLANINQLQHRNIFLLLLLTKECHSLLMCYQNTSQ